MCCCEESGIVLWIPPHRYLQSVLRPLWSCSLTCESPYLVSLFLKISPAIKTIISQARYKNSGVANVQNLAEVEHDMPCSLLIDKSSCFTIGTNQKAIYPFKGKWYTKLKGMLETVAYVCWKVWLVCSGQTSLFFLWRSQSSEMYVRTVLRLSKEEKGKEQTEMSV